MCIRDRASAALGRFPVERYRDWFAGLPEPARRAVEEHWGAAPGAVSVERSGADRSFYFSGLPFGNVVVAVQPPRGFGENPVAVYHSPDLAPTHHYLAFYRWLEGEFGAHAIVHVGKHGTLEWLPGKGVGLSASCFPDVALGNLPLVYPFVVNDPGEGTQAKRRTHAVVVDHLVPPLTRADSYDDVARLEELLDRHAQLLALDPSKLPTIRAQVWEALVEAEIHRDLGLAADVGEGRFEDPAFDDVLVDVDGYLCELKDAQIRGGLHVLGQPPSGRAELDMIAAITRLPQGCLLYTSVLGSLTKVLACPGLRIGYVVVPDDDGQSLGAAGLKERLARRQPVSYTHLDVYKRQLLVTCMVTRTSTDDVTHEHTACPGLTDQQPRGRWFAWLIRTQRSTRAPISWQPMLRPGK